MLAWFFDSHAASRFSFVSRVNVDTLEHLMTMVSELVLTRNQLLEISRRNEDTEFKVPLQRLSNVTAELQEGVMKTRMQPIDNVWNKLPRVVRDLARSCGNQVRLELEGGVTASLYDFGVVSLRLPWAVRLPTL